MAVIRNPVLFVLFAIMAGGGYLVVQAGLLGPLMKIGNAVVNQSVEIARVSPHRSLLMIGFFEEFCSSPGEDIESTCFEERSFRSGNHCNGQFGRRWKKKRMENEE